MSLKEEDDIRIAVISPNIYPCVLGGGLEVFNHYFIKELAAQGHKIWIFSHGYYNWNNEHIYPIKLRRGAPGLMTFSLFYSLIFNLIKLKDKIDIIHIPYTSNDSLVIPILFIKKLLDIPYIPVIHGGGMFEWKLKLIHESFFKNADAVVAVSEIIGKEYEKRTGREIKVIPPLLPFKESKISKTELKNRYGLNEKDIVILFLGSINKIKGSDVLLEAFLSLGKEFINSKNLKLIYVGDGDKKEELERITIEKNVNQYVKFCGRIPYEKVCDMYKLADIYIIPSLFEGKPISLLEAMFNGLPIIGSNVNGINNVIKHKINGILFEKANSDDLKNKIIELIDNPILARRLGNSAKNDYSKQYVFQTIILDHIKLYKQAIDFSLR